MEAVANTIPSEATSAFSRESFLRPPDWRYQAAVRYIQDKDDGILPAVPSDPLVLLVAKAVKACRDPRHRELVERCWKPLYEAIYLGTTAADSAITSETESLLIQGADRNDPEVRVLPFSGDVYDLYAKIFFDLSGICAVHSWMQDYLLAPPTGRNSFSAKLRTRLLSYYGGRDAARRVALTGVATGNAMALMKTLMGNERQKRLFDYVMQHMKIDDVNYALLMEAAVKDMSARDFTEHMKDREDAGSSSLEDIASGLEAGIRAFSQSEIEGGSTTGLDFVNQYTASILGRQNGTEDLDN